ncbi:DUF664 domain-containing protein [Isoptericola jiangsuensis]|uniref:DinB family protein n=1 Tax=Isoptericola jiangsuensis TaxID=548579 RepID=UPI003AACE0F8
MPSPRPRVVVLSGPSGAGKSTVATLLATGARRRTVNLTTDTFYSAVATGFVPPYLEGSAHQNAVVVDAVVAAVTAWARGGYDVVVDGVVGAALLRPFRRAALHEGWDLRYVVLRPALDVVLARAAARNGAGDLRDEAALRSVHALFDDLGELSGHLVDTGAHVADATAASLRAALDSDGFRVEEPPGPAPWPHRVEPPLRGDEITTLRAFLDYHRDTLRRKTSGLDSTQLSTRLAPSSMTLGGLLKHLAYVESNWFTEVLDGADPLPPFDDADWSADRDWEWSSASADTADELRHLFDAAVAASDARVDAALAAGDGLDRLGVRESRHGDGLFSLRWILVHMIEEYARHNGHADLLREAVDGAVGE